MNVLHLSFFSSRLLSLYCVFPPVTREVHVSRRSIKDYNAGLIASRTHQELNNQESLLPSREKLMAELQAFAESNTITGALNLKNLAPSETLAGAAQHEERRKAFQAFLTGYLDAAVRSIVTNLERIDKETTQPDGSVAKEPAIVVREDETKSFKGALFFWNLRPDESVSITRLKDGSQVTPESATPNEMNAIRDFVVKCHEKYLQNQPMPDNDNDPPSQKQKPRKPRL